MQTLIIICFQLYKFAEKSELIAMELSKMSTVQDHYPSRTELENMSNHELFALANKSAMFKEVMVKFILTPEKKPLEVIYDEEGKYDLRIIGLSERLKNALRLGDFVYLTELTVMKKSDLLKLRGLGKTSLEELAEVMDRYGLQFID